MADLRYVFSAPAMLRLNRSKYELENTEDYTIMRHIIREGIERIQKDVLHAIPGHTFNIDLLFNAYTEKIMAPRFTAYKNFGFDQLYADSGGLQIVTAGLKVDDSLKADIYNTQAHADYGMCFDEIPCGSVGVDNGKSARSQTSNKVYYPDRAEASATKTAHNIREQIEVLDKINARTKVFYIIQGNTCQDMVKWFEYGTKVLQPSNYDRIAGLALADTCMGNGPRESIAMLASYHLIHKTFGEDKIKKHVHLLGVGSVPRLLPLFYMVESGFLPKDLKISFDSTSFSMGYFMGRFMLPDGTKITEGAHNYRKMFEMIWDYFGDIYQKYQPGIDKTYFLDHVNEQIRSIADLVNNVHDDYEIVTRANITLTCIWQVLGFCQAVKKALEHAKYDHSPTGKLQDVKTWEDFEQWQKTFGSRVVSKKIGRHKPSLEELMDLMTS